MGKNYHWCEVNGEHATRWEIQKIEDFRSLKSKQNEDEDRKKKPYNDPSNGYQYNSSAMKSLKVNDVYYR